MTDFGYPAFEPKPARPQPVAEPRKPRKPMGELGRLAWAWGSGAAFGFALANLLRVVLS